MASQATITAFDGAGTPVSHALLAVGVTQVGKKVVASWREDKVGVPLIGQVLVTATYERLDSGIYKLDVRVAVPVLETAGTGGASGYVSQPKVAYTLTYGSYALFHERSTTAERRLARQLSVNIQGGVTASVAPITGVQIPDFFDVLINPS